MRPIFEEESLDRLDKVVVDDGRLDDMMARKAFILSSLVVTVPLFDVEKTTIQDNPH